MCINVISLGIVVGLLVFRLMTRRILSFVGQLRRYLIHVQWRPSQAVNGLLGETKGVTFTKYDNSGRLTTDLVRLSEALVRRKMS